MAHEHHHHDHTVTSLNKAFILGIALNVAFVVVEFAVGLYYGSMGLLSDAGHNLSDVASLLLAMLAFRLAQAHATPRYTYGYKKSTVLISLLNSVILLVAVGVIVAESVGRMLHPAPVEGGAIAWTAGVGVVINGFTAWLFMKDKDKDLNVKGAYLHMAADALVSVGVLVSGVVISWTGWTIVDPVVGLVVAAVIVASVWSLTRDCVCRSTAFPWVSASTRWKRRWRPCRVSRPCTTSMSGRSALPKMPLRRMSCWQSCPVWKRSRDSSKRSWKRPGSIM